MKSLLPRLCSSALLGAALLIPLAVNPTALFADEREHRYHDERHHDDHEWNDREDRAYRIWVRDNHRKFVEFGRLRDGDRQRYWNWRHEHNDALLKIEIH